MCSIKVAIFHRPTLIGLSIEYLFSIIEYLLENYLIGKFHSNQNYLQLSDRGSLSVSQIKNGME